ncbi:MAG: gamma-glutamylcyclotransferase [Acidobacteria bacterium]|nr:gamma-glutamylcyclotransferase [Acidobacteriota bacterium]
MAEFGHGHGLETRLAVYGSLAPGEVNHHQLEGLKGRWIRGSVRGRRYEAGWGQWIGFPGLVLDAEGPEVAVQVFESADLPEHWARLDEFEGPGYRRVEVAVTLVEGGVVRAYVYELAS